MEDNKKRGRPQKYVFWSDWESWLIKEWYVFKQNDLPHLRSDIAGLKKDMSWIKWLLGGVVLVLIGAAVAVLTRG